MALNTARVAKAIGLTNAGYYQVVVEYYDSAAPATVLWSETFSLPRPSTVQALQDAVIQRGQEVRTALADLAAAQASVPVGATVAIP